ncbi:tRNA pseudouridine(38/39) synthase [Halotydeus destructor]|nr:tRNA pseudouridine(38/39) synthase [Halotydeus destructor]
MANLAVSDLSQLSKQELIDKVVALQSHVTQLRNILAKKSVTEKQTSKNGRKFDFNRFKKRHVALKFLYLGWDYEGYVAQEETTKTIEHHLFQALLMTKLIEDRETSNYHRCGRTDKGVSAFSQVISIDLRSNVTSGKGVFEPENYSGVDDETKEEISYCALLNKVLPPGIRCISWAPVERSFSARFDCRQRTYKYFMPRGNLDISKMNEAAQHLIGLHDFRNLCKMDIRNGVTAFMRSVSSARIEECSESNCDLGFNLLELTIVGKAYLWHQIRCIVAVLLLVGEGYEQPDIIKKLLDIETNPRKPQYNMALEHPLNLFDCRYEEEEDMNWVVDDTALTDTVSHLQSLWSENAVKCQMIKRMLEVLCNLGTKQIQVRSQHEILSGGVRHNNYKPLLERQLCDSLEERLTRSKRSKISDDGDSMDD